MIQISMKTGREAVSFCLYCGRKVPSHRKASFHLIKSNELNFKRFHIRCHSTTKVIRGTSNGSQCDVKFDKNNGGRSLKGVLELAQAWNNSLTALIFVTIKRAASLNGNSVLYFKQSLQTPSGTVHTTSSAPFLSSKSRNIGSGGDNQESSPLIEEESTVWTSVKVSIASYKIRCRFKFSNFDSQSTNTNWNIF